MDMQVPATEVLPFRDGVRAMLDRVEAHGGPIVSLYLDVHADTDPNAPPQRTDAALRQLALDRRDRERLEDAILEAMKDVGEGYFVLFSALDPDELFEHRLLRVAPPLPGGEQEALARLGRPLTAPLRLLLASEPAAVIAYVDERRARIFELDVGDVREISSSVRALNSEEWRNYRHKSTGDPGQIGRPGMGRAGSGRDEFEARVDAWTTRFTKALADRLADEVGRREDAQLVLLGEPGRTEQVQEALPAHLKETHLSGGAAVADPDQAVGIWARPLHQRVAELRVQQEEPLMAELENRSFETLGETLDALQKGLLERVAVPVDFDVEVIHCLENGWIAETEEQLREICEDGPIERLSLKERLAEAARQVGAEVTLLRGPGAEKIQNDYGGIAGLPRR